MVLVLLVNLRKKMHIGFMYLYVVVPFYESEYKKGVFFGER